MLLRTHIEILSVFGVCNLSCTDLGSLHQGLVHRKGSLTCLLALCVQDGDELRSLLRIIAVHCSRLCLLALLGGLAFLGSLGLLDCLSLLGGLAFCSPGGSLFLPFTGPYAVLVYPVAVRCIGVVEHGSIQGIEIIVVDRIGVLLLDAVPAGHIAAVLPDIKIGAVLSFDPFIFCKTSVRLFELCSSADPLSLGPGISREAEGGTAKDTHQGD